MRFVVAIPLLMMVYLGNSQGIVNNGSVISVMPNSRVTVSDNFVNNGIVTNHGTISVSGNWQNNGTYIPGNGSLLFDSNLEQTIDHSGQSMASLMLQGGGEKLFISDLTIIDEIEVQRQDSFIFSFFVVNHI